MGMIIEGQIRAELEALRAETNVRLDDLIAEQRRSNELLVQLLAALAPAERPQREASYAAEQFSWR